MEVKKNYLLTEIPQILVPVFNVFLLFLFSSLYDVENFQSVLFVRLGLKNKAIFFWRG